MTRPVHRLHLSGYGRGGRLQVVARAPPSTGGERSKFLVVSQKDEPLGRVPEADLIYSRIGGSVRVPVVAQAERGTRGGGR